MRQLQDDFSHPKEPRESNHDKRGFPWLATFQNESDRNGNFNTSAALKMGREKVLLLSHFLRGQTILWIPLEPGDGAKGIVTQTRSLCW